MTFFCQYCVLFGQCVCVYHINIRGYTLGYAWLVPVFVHIAEIDLHTSTVIKSVTKIPETTKNSV